MAAPQKLDLYLQGLGAFQEGAATLKSGDPLCLQQLEGGRLACVTQGGTPVGLVPADKRGMLMRGPWSGTVRSMRWQAVAPAAAAAGEAGGTAEGTPAAVAVPPQEAPQDGAAPPPSTQQQEQQQQEADQAGAQLAALVVQQVLVRFTPEEQRWQQRGAEPEPPAGDGATAHLSWEQFEQLGGQAGQGLDDGWLVELHGCHCMAAAGVEGGLPALSLRLNCHAPSCMLTLDICYSLAAHLACIPTQRPARRCGGCCGTRGCRRWWRKSTRRPTPSG